MKQMTVDMMMNLQEIPSWEVVTLKRMKQTTVDVMVKNNLLEIRSQEVVLKKVNLLKVRSQEVVTLKRMKQTT